MTEDLTVAKDRVARARRKLKELRSDPDWIEQHPHHHSVEQGLKRKAHYAELCEQFAAEAGPAAKTAVGQAMVKQAAALSLKLEQLQLEIVRGHRVRVDDVV